jgi:phospholipase/carboxylesterase
MPDTNYWRQDRPGEGITTSLRPDPQLPLRHLAPTAYEPGYPYPLVVLFHPRGGNEDHVLRIAPRVSGQNFVFLSLRGPEQLAPRADGKLGFGWDHADGAEMLAEYVRLSVEYTRRSFHIHSERIYLAGVGEGATAAFRAGLVLADKIAGVVALNGGLPKPANGNPVFRMDQVRGLRVFLGYGRENGSYTPAAADRDFRALYGAGADVKCRGYKVGNHLHANMLRDINRWIIGNVEQEYADYQLK